MITVRTPLRVSFLGGGSDYPGVFQGDDSFGSVLGTTVNLYVHLFAIPHTSLASHKYKFTYSAIEEVNDFTLFKHPVISKAFSILDWESPGLHISTMADVPAGTGLGSSSAFTVGLLQLLSSFQGKKLFPEQLARLAIRIEREMLSEPGGYQDQYHASYGGLALYNFSNSSTERLDLNKNTFKEFLSSSMILVPNGKTRNSGKIAAKTLEGGISKPENLRQLANLARETYLEIVKPQSDLNKLHILAEAMNHSWEIKKSLAEEISNANVDEMVEYGLSKGALAAKLCGAGESGFVLFLIEPTKRDIFRNELAAFNAIDISIEEHGSRILWN